MAHWASRALTISAGGETYNCKPLNQHGGRNNPPVQLHLFRVTTTFASTLCLSSPENAVCYSVDGLYFAGLPYCQQIILCWQTFRGKKPTETSAIGLLGGRAGAWALFRKTVAKKHASSK